MSDLLVRNVQPEVLAYLKERAGREGRSVQAALSAILAELEERESHARRAEEFWKEADALHARIAASGRPQTDSAELRHVGRRGE